jgi:hypothetical protein
MDKGAESKVVALENTVIFISAYLPESKYFKFVFHQVQQAIRAFQLLGVLIRTRQHIHHDAVCASILRDLHQEKR